jgi:cell wall-associated NlpC family hydrolase
VYYVLNKSGVKMSRKMGGQLASGPRISTKELQPGDLVFFSNTYKRGLSHAGIYIGGGKFVHAENERTGVKVSELWSAYWGSHFTAAVRPRK